MANRIPVKAIYSGSDVTSLGEFVSGDTIDVSYIADGSVTAAKLAADTATQAELDAVAAAALPLAGGTMTGNLVMGTNLVDGIDISARDAVLTSTTTTANAALPKTGGIITAGEVDFNDNIKARFGTGKDLNIYHDGSNSYVEDASVGDLILKTDGAAIKLLGGTDTMAKGTKDGAFGIYHDNNIKLATTSTGVTVTGGAVGTMTTDNDGSFAMSASNNFKCTPAGNFALTFTAIVAQSGNILFINSGGHTISAHANTKVDANFLATVSTAGTYLVSYFSDGTNVYMTNSAVYT